MQTFPRKSLVFAALLLLASGLASASHAQKKSTDVATITLSDGGKFKTAPDGTVSIRGTVTNNTGAPLMLCGFAFAVDPDTIDFSQVSLDFYDLNQSFVIGAGQTVAFQPIDVTVSGGFRRAFFLGDIGAAVSPGGCFGQDDVQIPIAGDMYKIKVRD